MTAFMLGYRVNLWSCVVRTFNTSCKHCANHYDVLGITPKATQNEIKTAYYELSKRYHPDKSPDEVSATKFRLISEAYEVLGNVNLKKMYDRGLLGGGHSPVSPGYQPEEEPLDPKLRFYKSRNHRSVTPTMDGRTPIYNFDAWSKNHYNSIFEKAQYDKDVLRKKREKQQDSVNSSQQETFLFFMIGLVGLFAVFVAHGTPNFDKDTVNSKDGTKTEP